MFVWGSHNQMRQFWTSKIHFWAQGFALDHLTIDCLERVSTYNHEVPVQLIMENDGVVIRDVGVETSQSPLVSKVKVASMRKNLRSQLLNTVHTLKSSYPQP